MLTYGMKVKLFPIPTLIQDCVLYINHINPKIINYCVPRVKRIEEINMLNITAINFGKDNGNFICNPPNKEIAKIPAERCLTIRSSKDFIDLIFDTETHLYNFCSGLVSFFTEDYLDEDPET